MKKFLLRFLRLGVIAYVAVLVMVAGCQNRMLYFPRVSPEPVLLKEAVESGVDPWRDPNGGLIGWRIVNPKAKARLLVFHGNAIDAVIRSNYLHAFDKVGGGANWETYVMEYPGYGARPGTPGRSAFYEAARAAIAQLRAADSRPIVLLGESIGSGTACAMAAEQPDAVAGLVLVVPFARLVEVAQRVMPYLPVSLLLRDAYDNIESLQKYRGRVVFVVAEKDEVVSAEQGRKLAESYAGPKLFIELSDTTHNSFEVSPNEPWVISADKFLQR